MRKIKHAAAIALTLILTANQSEAEILQRTLPDGTVEYYNIPDRAKNKSALSSKYDAIIDRACLNEGIDPYLIKCIIKVESDFNPDAVSVSGAMGLMQLMQDTARYFRVKDPLNPEENINAGTKHFKSLYRHFSGDVELALAAYHAGIGRVKNRALPPIRATVDYVNRVMKLYSGKESGAEKVKRLYKRIDREGDILIYN